MIDELLIPARFCGPPQSANGGYTAGSLARVLTGPTTGEGVATVSVRLSQPPPLESPMHVNATPEGVDLTVGGAVVASATRSTRELEVVEPVGHGDAVAASDRYLGLLSHPFPTCFSCGPDREDGLRIFPGEVPATGGGRRVAAAWTPRDDLRIEGDEAEGSELRAGTASTWAALDCIGGWAGEISGGRPVVLGTMSARLDALPVIGEPHVVVGQFLDQQGRRTMTASTLYDSDGRIVGTAEHTWIAVDPATFAGTS